MKIKNIIVGIDSYLEETVKTSIGPAEANTVLEQMEILTDRAPRPGKPLRVLLRQCLIPHAYQVNGKNSAWILPHT